MRKENTYLSEKELLKNRNEYLAIEIRKSLSQCDYDDINTIIGDREQEDARQQKTFHRMIDEFNLNAERLKELNRYITDAESGVASEIELTAKVKCLRDEVGYTLQEIAEKLGYSYQHIRRVAAKVGK